MATCGSYGNSYGPGPVDGGCGGDNAACNDCFTVQQVATQKVPIKCKTRAYVPYWETKERTVCYTVPKTVKYTEWVCKDKQEKYTDTVKVQKWREEERECKTPYQTTVKKEFEVTKKVPKTIYVEVKCKETRDVPVTLWKKTKKTVRIPYMEDQQVEKWKTVKVKIPVEKTKCIQEKKTKTVTDKIQRIKCVEKEKICYARVPVYCAKPKPQPGCPPNTDCGSCEQTTNYGPGTGQVTAAAGDATAAITGTGVTAAAGDATAAITDTGVTATTGSEKKSWWFSKKKKAAGPTPSAPPQPVPVPMPSGGATGTGLVASGQAASYGGGQVASYGAAQSYGGGQVASYGAAEQPTYGGGQSYGGDVDVGPSY